MEHYQIVQSTPEELWQIHRDILIAYEENKGHALAPEFTDKEKMFDFVIRGKQILERLLGEPQDNVSMILGIAQLGGLTSVWRMLFRVNWDFLKVQMMVFFLGTPFIDRSQTLYSKDILFSNENLEGYIKKEMVTVRSWFTDDYFGKDLVLWFFRIVDKQIFLLGEKINKSPAL